MKTHQKAESVHRHTPTPILFFNTGKEDREAYLLVKDSGINCEFRAPTLEELAPFLLFGYQRFVGIDEIRVFVSSLEDRIKKVKTV